jgi:drug/metabolite transporter (DMT)-like permease
VQLAAAALVLLPYSLLTEGADALRGMDGGTVLLLLLLGVVHTGLAYFLYFGAMGQLPAQTVAILSYLDPTVAILLSTLVLQESISLFGMLGAALVLIAALVSELPAKKKK